MPYDHTEPLGISLQSVGDSLDSIRETLRPVDVHSPTIPESLGRIARALERLADHVAGPEPESVDFDSLC